MANESRRPWLLSPRFLLLCLYTLGYVLVRSSGDIVYQVAEVRSPSGPGGRQYIVGARPDLPRWRRQLCRAAFSLPMVVEEEAMRHYDAGRSLYNRVLRAVGRLLSEAEEGLAPAAPAEGDDGLPGENQDGP